MFDLENYEYFEDVNLGLMKLNPRKKRILDVGCGSGLLGKKYKDMGNYVVGIDLAKEVKQLASKRLNEFYLTDITDFVVVKKIIRSRKFDVVVLADILEHIYDPVAVVNFYKRYLKPDGQIFVSVPNVAVWYVRWSILFGRFRYTNTGTLDKTHIRFFTDENIGFLSQQTSLEIKRMNVTPGMFRCFVPLVKKLIKKPGARRNKNAILESPLYNFYLKWVYPVESFFCNLFPGLLGFQYIVILS